MKYKNRLPGVISRWSSVVGRWPNPLGRISAIGWFLLMVSVPGWTQAADPSSAQQSAQSTDATTMTAAVRELQEEVRELRSAVVELRSEAGQYRAETEQLRRELQATHNPGTQPEAATGSEAAPTDALEDRVTSLEESSQVLSSKVDDQYQTKIEAASKYRMRLSGIMLLNLFGNRGSVDNQDFPTWAIGSGANLPGRVLGASLRQSEVGLGGFRSASGRRENDGKSAGRFFRRIHQHPGRGQFRAGAAAHRQHADGLEGHFDRGRARQRFHLSAVADFVRVAWPYLLLVMPATFGDGFHKCEWSIALSCPKANTSRCRAASWTT